MPTSRCSAEQDATRLFIDALRACLGLAPLYATETAPVYGEETHVPMTGVPHEGRQYGVAVRHEVRLVAVEEAHRERARALPVSGVIWYRGRRRYLRKWDWTKKPEAAE